MLYDLCHIHLCPSLLQERMIGEIDKLRNEIDHLKRRSGAFGDGAHPRYLSQLSHNIISFFTQFRVLHVLPLKTTGLTWEAPATSASLWWRAKMATTAQQ